jgi:hypothetical protein
MLHWVWRFFLPQALSVKIGCIVNISHVNVLGRISLFQFCFFLSQCLCLRTSIAVILNSMHRFVQLWANMSSVVSLSLRKQSIAIMLFWHMAWVKEENKIEMSYSWFRMSRYFFKGETKLKCHNFLAAGAWLHWSFGKWSCGNQEMLPNGTNGIYWRWLLSPFLPFAYPLAFSTLYRNWLRKRFSSGYTILIIISDHKYYPVQAARILKWRYPLLPLRVLTWCYRRDILGVSGWMWN